MVRIISRGLLKPDDPIFSGGLETFSVRRPRPEEDPKDADDEIPPDDDPLEKNES